MAGYAFGAEEKGERSRRELFTTCKRSALAARSFSLKISNHAVGSTTRQIHGTRTRAETKAGMERSIIAQTKATRS